MLLFLNTNHLNLNKYKITTLTRVPVSFIFWGVCFDVSAGIPALASTTIHKCAESCGKTFARTRTPVGRLQ